MFFLCKCKLSYQVDNELSLGLYIKKCKNYLSIKQHNCITFAALTFNLRRHLPVGTSMEQVITTTNRHSANSCSPLPVGCMGRDG